MSEEDLLPSPPPVTITVTYGHTSFLSRSLIPHLLSTTTGTHTLLRILDPLPPPLTTPPNPRVHYIQTDFTDLPKLKTAIQGSTVVFHVDPTAGVLVPPAVTEWYGNYKVVVDATRKVVRACRESGVERLVYTGVAVVDGVNEFEGGDENSFKCPDEYEDTLNELRAQAEVLVLKSNGRNGLSTCALRIGNPFGPGDEHFVPFLVAKAKSGWAKFIIGSGKNMCDFSYVENVAHANICAEKALCSGVTPVAGKAFLITNLEKVMCWEFISNLLEGLGYQRPEINLPVKLVLLLVVLVKWVHKKLGLSLYNSSYTSAIVRFLSCTRTFDCSRAQSLIGYEPVVSLQDGIALTVESFSRLARGLPHSRQEDLFKPSKAETLLGNGEVADILLWRDEKRTFTYLLALFMLFYWYLLCGRTFISSTAKLLLLMSLVLFGQGFLPSSMLGLTVEKIPSSYFEVSGIPVRHSFITLASFWNRGFCTLKSASQGDNWNVFVKVAGYLFMIKLLLPFSLSVLIGVGLVCLFSFFIVYEQYEGEIDKLMTTAVSGLNKLKGLLIAKLPRSMLMLVRES